MKKLVILITIIGAVLLTTSVGFFYLLDQHMKAPLEVSDKQLITISAGTSVNSFSKELVSKGWIVNRFWLRAYARIFSEKAQIKKGTYLISSGDSLYNVLAKIVDGKEHQFTVTFVEGSTLKEWLTQLKHQPGVILTPELNSVEQLAIALNIDQRNPEGWFFPDTYAFTKNTKAIDILARAHQQMKSTLDELWRQRDSSLPYDNSYQVLIMASIIEKETGLVDEQPTIASVFINRLIKKMRLQTDPTVIYGLGERYQGNITRSHLKEKTAYNTYRINGLPPTPIAMPGLSALKASLQPANTNFYYFVSRGDGSHQFSETLQQHNKAVAKYQLGKS